MKSNYCRHSSTGGFTLLELMVAMAITFVIVGILVTITGSAIDTWTRSREELRAARQAKAMVDLMANDFESMVTRAGGQDEWMAAVSNVPAQGGSTNAANIIFFTAATDRYEGQVGVDNMDNGGDVSCVGYQLQWKDPVNSGTGVDYETFVLKRHLVDPDKTFEVLLGKTVGQPLDELYLVNYSGNLDASTSFVCENIFQFTVVFHVESTVGGALVNTLVPIRAGVGTQQLRIKGNRLETLPEIADVAGGSVTAVEISLSVVTDAGITQLRNNSSLSENPKWVNRNTYQYSKLVQLPRK